MKDYTGKICGCWKVIERDYHPKSKSHETFWIAQCQNCGNITSVRKTDLDRQPKHCNNCKGEPFRSWVVGDKYGLLTIIGKGTIRSDYVKVQCDCGSDPFEVRLSHLRGQGRNGKTISCGCTSESSGEIKIRQILENANLNFQKQYRVKNEDGEVMVFDFVIFDDNNKIIKCIEYNGQQHYHPVDFFGGQAAFERQKTRDARKADYCRTHSIILQEIPYTSYDSINLEMLLSSISDLKK